MTVAVDSFGRIVREVDERLAEIEAAFVEENYDHVGDLLRKLSEFIESVSACDEAR